MPQKQRPFATFFFPNLYFLPTPREKCRLAAPLQLLQELRNYLQHFDQTGHLGESDTCSN
jgi:hypothetical protein